MKLFIDQIDQLLIFFRPHCADVETIDELRMLLHEPRDWVKAHYLSARIRTKAIASVKQGDLKGEMQFSFEETCAKVLHNLSESKKPFEYDTPYWIIPLALKLAKVLEIDESKIVEIALS
jgi:hypothetical protein